MLYCSILRHKPANEWPYKRMIGPELICCHEGIDGVPNNAFKKFFITIEFRAHEDAAR